MPTRGAPRRSPCCGCAWTTGRWCGRSRRTAPRWPSAGGSRRFWCPSPRALTSCSACGSLRSSRAVASDGGPAGGPPAGIRGRCRLAPLPAAERDQLRRVGAHRGAGGAGRRRHRVGRGGRVVHRYRATGHGGGQADAAAPWRAGPSAGARGERLGIRLRRVPAGLRERRRRAQRRRPGAGGGQAGQGLPGADRGTRAGRGRDRAVHPLQPAHRGVREPVRRLGRGHRHGRGEEPRQRGAQPARAPAAGPHARGGAWRQAGGRLADLAAVLPGGRGRGGGTGGVRAGHPAAGDRSRQGGAGGLLGGGHRDGGLVGPAGHRRRHRAGAERRAGPGLGGGRIRAARRVHHRGAAVRGGGRHLPAGQVLPAAQTGRVRHRWAVRGESVRRADRDGPPDRADRGGPDRRARPAAARRRRPTPAPGCPGRPGAPGRPRRGRLRARAGPAMTGAERAAARLGLPLRLPESITARLRVPVIAAPMLAVSGPELVIAACRAGVVGAFPTLNPRSPGELDAWLTRIDAGLADLDGAAAPVCPNLVMRSPRLHEDVAVLARHRVELVITSVGSPAPVIGPLHDAGALVLADVASLEHAHKAVDAGADGLVLLVAGAGGQTGWLNPFAFVRAVREFYAGPVVMAGGMSDGVALAAARLLGCDLGYIGTRFIATPESMADDDYRAMLVQSTMDDVLLTRAFNGLWGSFLRPSVVRAGLDPDRLDEMVTPRAAAARFGSGGSAGARRWSDIRSAGHSVAGVRAVESVAAIVERTRREYETAMGSAPPPQSPPQSPLPAPRPGSVEAWAAEEPDRAVLFEGDRSMTWAQINDAADSLAEGLATRGVGAGDIVVVRTQIRLEWVVIDAALAKLGCLLLGLNWRLTPDEVRYVLANSGARAVICDDPDPAPLAGAFDGAELVAAVSLDARADGFQHYADLVAGPPVRRISVAEPRLVIYTSGTTGLPKGVVMAPRPGLEREAAEYLADVAARSSRRTDDVYLATMPFSHGAGPGHVRGALRAGAWVVFLRRFDAEAALALMVRHGVTSWASVPTMLKRIAALPQDVLDAHRPSTLRHVSTGAAPVSAALKHWVAGYFGDVLHEGYGATEVGMITHATPEMRIDRPSSSGLPHRHVTIEIRDGAGDPLPAGRTGEIWVRTPVVINSYLNGAPLGPDVLDAAGFFRTGDIGHLDEQGYLFITDRAKDMIVSGGVNLYPAEIEAALLTHPKVQDAAVIGIPDEEFGEQVKAFVELKPGQPADPAEIAEGIAGALASYKRPRSIEIVEELPRNLMGKLLKKDLRAPYWEGRERQV